ncbi:hypothetical protein M413DRAFT_31841 [Hebeloma cylindrosporum]|uniref:F-box domain-containing protein n=1 Tax=Hebeloma cylindrosporum TaxID=76867 RepID=A0A0C2XEB4_HEBCY|nr:hypothetical protein M413DRAFT_31841 [Hebeloma cylindrosporum h7]
MSCFFSITGDLITEEVLCRLSLVDLISCLSACKRLNELITSSTNLVYLMELEMAGMVDNPHCSYEKYPRNRRLDMLKEHNRRWETFDCQWREDVQLPVRVKGAYRVTTAEGHLLLLPLDEQHIDQIGGDIYSAPLPDYPKAKLQWNKIRLGKHLRPAKAALLEHDLLVCFTITPAVPSDGGRMQIHLIQHSSGGPHPDASCPTLDLCADYNAENIKLSCISIAGAHLVFLLDFMDGPHIEKTFLNLWNWKSGRCVKSEMVGHSQELYKGDLLLLREDLLMIVNVEALSLDIYLISDYTESGAINDAGDIQLIKSLLLPKLASQASLKWMTFSGSRRSINSNPSSFAKHGLKERPFINDPLNSLVCTSLCIKSSRLGGTYTMMCDFVAPLRAFLAHAVEALATYRKRKVEYPERLPHITVTPIAWNLWGPKSTRWFPFKVNPSDSESSMQIVRSIHGARFFLVHITSEGRPARMGSVSHITLIDFDRWRVRRPPSHRPVRRETSCIPSGAFFSEPITSCLPYLYEDVPPSFASDREQVNRDGGSALKNLWARMQIHEQEIIRFPVSRPRSFMVSTRF